METDNSWHDDIVREIGECREKFNKKDYKKYRLDFLVRAAKRVDGFSEDCNECESLRGEITKLVEGLGSLVEPSKENRKSHLKAVRIIIKHLEKRHKLICEGEYTAIGISIGAGFGVAMGTMGMVFGVAIGAAMQNVAIGIPIGIGVGSSVGLAIGSCMEAKAKKDGKVI